MQESVYVALISRISPGSSLNQWALDFEVSEYRTPARMLLTCLRSGKSSAHFTEPEDRKGAWSYLARRSGIGDHVRSYIDRLSIKVTASSSGYGCMDHFLEGTINLRLTPMQPNIIRATGDTCLHSWEVLAEILKSEEAKDIVCDIGMYVQSTLFSSYRDQQIA